MEKKFSKKEIYRVLRSGDVTSIYRLSKLMGYGVKPYEVCEFIRQYAPSVRIYDNAYCLAYGKRNSRDIGECYKGRYGYYVPLSRQYAFECVRRECSRVYDNYTKVPLYGYSRLYLAHPYYGHADYNKHSILKIRGNERFCELLMNYAMRRMLKKS